MSDPDFELEGIERNLYRAEKLRELALELFEMGAYATAGEKWSRARNYERLAKFQKKMRDRE